MTVSLRAWATPLVIGAFLLMGVTGVLMFFHLNTGLAKELHEWAGLLFVAGGLAHLWLNWRAFTTYLKRPLASGIMGLGALALGVSFLSLGGGGPGEAIAGVMQSVGNAPVSVLAQLSGKSADDVVATLSGLGLTGANADSTVSALTGGDREGQMAALGAVFASPATSQSE
ncbi:DUF4405 domain-containing protein [Rhodobacter ferrooxidans]|uniref:Flavinylation-associated cytochrome domain-containing protein n=1 Tax=Rhodobacter ferrooxidans TaxID=371731 RepID=C8RZX0_9RHOB|nr:DUF4405 domain-containing protein [Rhodobacter sp. SW2]EEW25579.1 conserved hypothetical protein [Rhodobacter sp. SW2]